MVVFVIIFMIVATIFALVSLGYIAVDIILEKRNKEEPKEKRRKNPQLQLLPLLMQLRRGVMPEIAEHIDAEEADAMISDSLAMKTAKYESGAVIILKD